MPRVERVMAVFRFIRDFLSPSINSELNSGALSNISSVTDFTLNSTFNSSINSSITSAGDTQCNSSQTAILASGLGRLIFIVKGYQIVKGWWIKMFRT